MSLAIVLRRIQIFLLVVTSLSTLYAADPAGPKIALQPLGPVKPDLLAQTKQALEQLYAVEVVLLPTRELPASAYYRPRDRYRAEKLLDWLQANADPQYVKIIGFTQSDISTTKEEFPDWGIFGLGQIGARPCVISSFRLARNVPRAKLLDRLGKVAGHEVGHTFGLPHCPIEGCLMHDAGGKVATVDGESGQLCEACRKQVPARPLVLHP